MFIFCFYHILCGRLDVKWVREKVENKRQIYVSKIHEVISFSLVNFVKIISPLVAIEPGVINFITDNVNYEVVWVKCGLPTCHV